MDPQTVPSSDPRQRILASALAVFAKRGFNGGSLTDIATGAELTRPGVLHHYPSKQAVLLALLDQRDREIQALLPDTSDWTLDDLLENLQEVAGAILVDRELVQLAHVLTAEAAAVDHPARPWVTRRHRQLRASFVTAIENSRAAGRMASDVDAGALAGAILGAVEGIENQWLVDPDFDALAALRTHCVLIARAVR